MKFRAIYIRFPEKLTERQENILIAHFKALLAQIHKQLIKFEKTFDSKSMKLLNFVSFGTSKPAMQYLDSTIRLLRIKLNHYVRLEAPDEKTYVFLYAYEKFDTLNMNRKLLGKEIKFNIFDTEDQIVDWLKNTVIPKVGYKVEDVQIEKKEIEQEVE